MKRVLLAAHKERLSFSRAALPLAAVLLSSATSNAQAPDEQKPASLMTESAPLPDTAIPNAPEPQGEKLSLLGTPKRIALDLVDLVQFPGRIRPRDEKWLIPLTAATVTAFALDERTMAEVVTSNPSTNATSSNVSDGLRDGFIAAPVLMYGLGLTTRSEHLRETGLLGGEAMTDAFIADAAIKLATFRERPGTDRSEGSFYRTSSGYNSSFVSGHSIVAWSSAAAIASEYPNRWVQFGVYTAATGVSITRVLAQEHFPSDVLLGSAAGWLIGRYVVRHHAGQRPLRASALTGRSAAPRE